MLLKKVISASRRLEMVGCFPDLLADILEKKCSPERVHTVLIWSKDPRNLIQHQRLRTVLRRYDQLYLHWTVTGMGASSLEPHVPSTEKMLSLLEEIIAFLGSPQRLRLRFDPIVHLQLPNGNKFTNLHYFEDIATAFAQAGVVDISVSWMETYPKVIKRLQQFGYRPLPVPLSQKLTEANFLATIAKKLKMKLHFCCVAGLPRSRCVDGSLLSKLHPKGELASTRRAKGQRPLCGCTESWDIGWYYPCPNGCLYCYANPKV
ncbi:hypothetical protein DRQ15_01715 [candidate division KSB1 bacterium]|nr:MAG: hypothetical protein B5M50_05295 [candidate division KSB1 bacterium 4484_219]RKY78224.1 MAG: hypothetical protein DRQ00_05605 [candidate division KSB1 bacterium]RKY85046.1 MAG: hypothetical protein DRP98_03695 [candidate division KSB1 bacterium]RKY92667.1 MAG: hypothetical protein DRQ15_01715 [candidate division KSB1 bacterium]